MNVMRVNDRNVLISCIVKNLVYQGLYIIQRFSADYLICGYLCVKLFNIPKSDFCNVSAFQFIPL